MLDPGPSVLDPGPSVLDLGSSVLDPGPSVLALATACLHKHYLGKAFASAASLFAVGPPTRADVVSAVGVDIPDIPAFAAASVQVSAPFASVSASLVQVLDGVISHGAGSACRPKTPLLHG